MVTEGDSRGKGGIQVGPFTGVDLRTAEANREETAQAFLSEAGVLSRKYLFNISSQEIKVSPKDLLLVGKDSLNHDSVDRVYFEKGTETGNFRIHSRAGFDTGGIWEGSPRAYRAYHYPSWISQYAQGGERTRLSVGPFRGKRFTFSDTYGPYASRETDNFLLSVDIDRSGHVDGIWGIHIKNGAHTGEFDFARVATTEDPIEHQLDYGTRTITTGENSVEGTYQRSEQGKDTVVLKVVQGNIPMGEIIIPTVIDNRSVVQELFPQSKFADPFNATPDADSSWKDVDLFKLVGIDWQLKERK